MNKLGLKRSLLLILLIGSVSGLFARGSFGTDLIPAAESVNKNSGEWILPQSLQIQVTPHFQTANEALMQWIETCGSTYQAIPLDQLDDNSGNPTIVIRQDDSIKSVEGYRLIISKQGIAISASSDAGGFYAVQSLRFLSDLTMSPIKLPLISINDAPRFRFRGVMLDSARHFQPAESIKRLLDQMALLKLNQFHWHLVDNNGWRIPIDSYPRLTEVGAFLYDTLEKERNGFYTKDEIRDIVAYAADRNIEVIPEIDVPGHSAAILEAYPEFLCPTNRDKPPVSERQGNMGYHEILCVGNPKLYPFLETIFRETVELFNCKLIHIGGDEVEEGIWGKCPLCQSNMDLSEREHEYLMQKAFLTDICKMLHEMDVKVINWSERVELGLPEVDYAQVWRGQSRHHETEAVNQGVPTVVSFGEFAYFDYPDYSGSSKSAWMPVLSLKKVYNYSIIPSIYNEAQRELIVGGECTLWTEEVLAEDIDAMMFPRLLAFSEQMWSRDENRRWSRFRKRLKTAKKRLMGRGIVFSSPVDSGDSLVKGMSVIAKPHMRSNYAEYGVDGNDSTAYISATKASKGDQYRVDFDQPVNALAVEVITGGYFVYDAPNSWLDGALVEVSVDGITFKTLGSLKRGQLKATIEGHPVKSVRIRCLKDYGFSMTVSEIRFRY